MHALVRLASIAVCLIGVGAFVAGCSSSDDTASDDSSSSNDTGDSGSDSDDIHIEEADVDRPADFAAAIVQIAGYRDTIRDEIAAGRPTNAHRPLDEATIVLEWLPEIVQESNIDKASWESVNSAAQSIRESFDAVHEKIDAGEEPDYSAVSDAVDAALESLTNISDAAAATTDGDENGGDDVSGDEDEDGDDDVSADDADADDDDESGDGDPS